MEIVMIIIYLLVFVALFAGQWKVYEKAGKQGWASIVPIYNIIVLLEIVKKPSSWLIMYFIPFVNIYYAILVTNELSKRFGKDTGFTIGLILLPIVFFPMLGFGDAKYIDGEIQ